LFDFKKQVGDGLYGLNLIEDDIIIPFRLLSLVEFNNCKTSLVLGAIPAQDIYDYVYRTCVLNKAYVEQPDDLRAGVPTTLAQLILYMSGPNDMRLVQDLLTVERHVAQTFESQMRTTICRAFNGYTMDKLDDLSFPQLVKLFAEAEASLLNAGLIEKHFEIVDRDAEEQQRLDKEEKRRKAIERYRNVQ